jgi:multiple sugar transport system permease protein/arabinosaccharide transport system permease protein
MAAANTLGEFKKTVKSPVRLKRSLMVLITNAILFGLVLLVAMPFVYMISASFKPQYEIFTYPVKIFPENLIFDNYQTLFGETLYVRWFFNTLFVASTRTLLSLFLCMLAGYAFAKFEFPFKKILFILVIASFTLPFEVLFVSLYKMMVTLGWFNSYLALIVPFSASAFGIFLARQYTLAFPTELIEAARIDGASEFGIFWRVVIPNLRPAIAVMGIIFFNGSWNDFLWPLIILNERTLYTVNLALPTLRGPYGDQYGLVLAGAVLATVPIICIFIFMQRHFIEGLMAGALKG